MGSKVGGLLKNVANVVLPNLGAAGGFANGLIQGQGLGGALRQGLGSGIQTAASMLAPEVGSYLGVPTQLAGAGLGAISGAGNAALSGRNALTGAITGGAGGYLTNGGGSSIGDIFGSSADSVTLPGIGKTSLENGTGLAGAAGKIGSSISSALGVGGGGGGSSYLPALAAIGGAANSLNANEEAKKALLKSQNQAMGALNPYLSSGTAANQKLGDLLGLNGGSTSTDEILASDPSYKFQLEQGNQALDRANAARGGYFSGAALKSAQDYGQGLANKTVNDYYQRLAQQSGAGQSAANSAGQIYGDTGSAIANAGISSANITNQTLGSLFGAGAYGRRYNPLTGQYTYA